MTDRKSDLIRSIADLREDFGFLLYLCQDLNGRLELSKKNLRKGDGPVAAHQEAATTEMIRILSDSVRANRRVLGDGLKKLSSADPNPDLVLSMAEYKYATVRNLRRLYGLAGAITTLSEWQSPSYTHSRWPEAGKSAGTIRLAMNDYKRDQHADTNGYEEEFRKAYIDSPALTTHVTATVSGMAALTTILSYLSAKSSFASRPIIIGSDSYWELKETILAEYGARAVSVDESDTGAVISAIRSVRPVAAFFDTIGNTERMLTPDLPAIADALRRNGNESYLVIDNTCAGPFCQPLRDLYRPLSKVRLIVFESLNKFHQYGLDRTTGGIIYARGGDTGHLFTARVHAGTNLPDTNAAMLPRPDRIMLVNRMKRLERNSLMLSSYLASRIRELPDIRRIVYPGLSDQEGISRKNQTVYGGAFFMVEFRSRPSLSKLNRIVRRFIRNAARSQVQAVAGTSFGLDIIRIYPTAIRSETTSAFLRIAPGTQSVYEIRLLGKLLFDALG